MIDISDGLSRDLAAICRASGVGAKIYESLVPLSRGSDIRSALNDGEDFELLLTAAKDDSRKIINRFRRNFKTPITAIGEITKDRGGLRLIDRYGRIKVLREGGYSHFGKMQTRSI